MVNTNSCCLQTCGGRAARVVSCCKQDPAVPRGNYLPQKPCLSAKCFLFFLFFPFFPPFEDSSWLTQRNHFECCWQKCCRKLCVVGGVFFLSLKRGVVLLCQHLEAGTVCSWCLAERLAATLRYSFHVAWMYNTSKVATAVVELGKRLKIHWCFDEKVSWLVLSRKAYLAPKANFVTYLKLLFSLISGM